MSFLFGPSRDPRRDPELVAGLARARRRLARDINDERALAFDDLPRPRRRGTWMIALVAAFMLLGAFGLLPRLGGTPPSSAVCTQPYLTLGSATARPGGLISWQAGGANGVDFLLAIDATAVRDSDGKPVADGGRLLSPPFRMVECEIAPARFAAPTGVGDHEVELFQRSGSRYVVVVTAPLTVQP